MQKRRIEYINILQESCKIETFTEIESLRGPTTLYGRLFHDRFSENNICFPIIKI